MVETRQMTQYRIFWLRANPMSGKAEESNHVLCSNDYDKLVNFIIGERNPGGDWRDGRWNKTFSKDSPLEWFNPPHSLELNNFDMFGHGIYDQWVNEDDYHQIMNSPFCYFVK